MCFICSTRSSAVANAASALDAGLLQCEKVSCAKWYHATCLAPAAESRAATHAIVAGGRWVCPPCRPLAPALPNVDFNAGASADAPGVPDDGDAPAAAVDAQCFARFPTGASSRPRFDGGGGVDEEAEYINIRRAPRVQLLRNMCWRVVAAVGRRAAATRQAPALGSGSSAGMHVCRRRCWGDSGGGATPLSGLHACTAGAARRDIARL